jgi:hypothetical protein
MIRGEPGIEAERGLPAPATAQRYDAFISYSHEIDGRLAPI